MRTMKQQTACVLSVCIVVLTFAGSDTANSDPAISKVDWYKPRPANLNVKGYATVYNELIVAVPARLHGEAIAALRTSDLIELTEAQARHFGFQEDPNAALRVINQRSARDIWGSQALIKEMNARKNEYSPHELQEAVQGQLALIRDKKAEINRYQAWMGRLKPYLIKAVTFQETHNAYKPYQREDFDGIFGADNLVIYFGSAGVTGNVRFKMIRIPVVAYLPKKPQHVYTEMTLLW